MQNEPITDRTEKKGTPSGSKPASRQLLYLYLSLCVVWLVIGVSQPVIVRFPLFPFPIPQRPLSLFISIVNGVVAYIYYRRLSLEKKG